MRPLIVSHGWGAGFVSEFIWDGCRDYAPLLGMSAALRALRVLGPQAVRAHQRALLAEAADLLTRAWGTGASKGRVARVRFGRVLGWAGVRCCAGVPHRHASGLAARAGGAVLW